MKNKRFTSKKISLFLFFAIITSMQTSHTSLIKYVFCGMVGHIFGLYKAYQHVYNNNMNDAQEKDEKKSFILFTKNIISNYQLIKELKENQEVKDTVEKLKKSIS